MACCDEHSRAELLRRGLAEAGRGLPGDRARHARCPAGTGLDRRSFVARGVGLALAVYGGAALRPQAFDEGIAAAAAASPQQKVLVSVFLDGGADALSLLAPTAIRSIVSCALGSRCLPAPAPFSPRTRPHLAPLTLPPRPASRRGQGQRDAGNRLRPPQPVALHLPPLLGGGRSGRAAVDRLARVATSTGSVAATILCRASRSTGACSRRSRRRRCPSPRSTPRIATTSGRAASGARCRIGWWTRSGVSARCPTHGDPGSRRQATQRCSRRGSTSS